MDGKDYKLTKNESLLFDKLERIESMLTKMYEGNNTGSVAPLGDAEAGDAASVATSSSPALPDNSAVVADAEEDDDNKE